MPRTLCLLATLVGASLAAPVHAATENYKLEPTHIDVVFTIPHLSFSNKHGSFHVVAGTLTYDAEKPEMAHADIVIRADSIDTGFAARDKDLIGPHFLDVGKYPEIHFVSRHITRTDNDHLQVEGDLTPHGVTRGVTLQTHLNGLGKNTFDGKPTVGFSATTSIRRSDFGIREYLPAIGDEVAITIDAEFNRPGPAH